MQIDREDYDLDNIEQKKNTNLVLDKDARINVTVNHPDGEDDYIDLVLLVRTMFRRFRFFFWVLLLCLAAGVSLALLAAQITRKPTTVSSVVTLNYEVAQKNARGDITGYKPVTDLTAPDGTTLDLSQITSSYVMQNALTGLELSHPVNLTDLRRNIKIDRILSEDSRRQQEVASNMIEDKNNQAYNQVQGIKLTYINRFIVSLTNGFGDENSRVKYELTDAELQLVLDRILDSYNDYMVLTYADLKLPDDEISIIDTDNQDILESIDLLRTASTDLYTFCEEKPDEIKNYRSWRTGFTLNDLVSALELVDRVNVDYLSSYVYTNGIVTDRDSMLTNYNFRLRDAQTKLGVVNGNIATTKEILDTYENDEIFVTMQESDTSKSTKTTTDYYNQLVTQQAENYAAAAELETTITDLENKIELLNTNTSVINTEGAKAELDQAMKAMYGIYERISEHYQEILESPTFTTLAAHSVAQNKTKSFLAGASKKLILGGGFGFVIACGLWFMDAMMAQLSGKKKQSEEEEVEA